METRPFGRSCITTGTNEFESNIVHVKTIQSGELEAITIEVMERHGGRFTRDLRVRKMRAAKHSICRRPIVFPETSRAVPVIESIRPVP